MSFQNLASSSTAILSNLKNGKIKHYFSTVLWTFTSIAIFVGLWEFAWWQGWANPILLPPPHIFLSNLSDQFRFSLKL